MAKISIQSTVLKKAVLGDKTAIKTMFHNFVSEDETIMDVQYLGSYGFLFKTKSFVCISDRRIASMEYGPYGINLYVDGGKGRYEFLMEQKEKSGNNILKGNSMTTNMPEYLSIDGFFGKAFTKNI